MEDALEIAAAKRGRKTNPRTSVNEKERELLFPFVELRRNKRGKRARGDESVRTEAKKRNESGNNGNARRKNRNRARVEEKGGRGGNDGGEEQNGRKGFYARENAEGKRGRTVQ